MCGTFTEGTSCCNRCHVSFTPVFRSSSLEITSTGTGDEPTVRSSVRVPTVTTSSIGLGRTPCLRNERGRQSERCDAGGGRKTDGRHAYLRLARRRDQAICAIAASHGGTRATNDTDTRVPDRPMGDGVRDRARDDHGTLSEKLPRGARHEDEHRGSSPDRPFERR